MSNNTSNRIDATAPVVVAAAAAIPGPTINVSATQPTPTYDARKMPTLVLTFFGAPGLTPEDSTLSIYGWSRDVSGIWRPRLLSRAEVRLGTLAGVEGLVPSDAQRWGSDVTILDGAGEVRSDDAGIASWHIPLEGCEYWSIGGTIGTSTLGFVSQLSARAI